MIHELDQEEVEKAETWTYTDARKLCLRLSQPYIPHGYFYQEDKDNIEAALDLCEEERIDPKIWFKAQFAYLGDFFARMGTYVRSGCFVGKKAAERYERFLFEKGKEKTRNVRIDELNKAFSDFYLPEFNLGEGIIIDRIGPEETLKLIDDLRKKYPRWNPNKWNIRIKRARIVAAVSVVDMLIAGASSLICPPEDTPWDWLDLLAVIEKVLVP